MEIQALQSLGSTNNATSSTDTTSSFSTMMDSLLTTASDEALSQLGSVQDYAEKNGLSTMQQTDASTYVSSFLLGNNTARTEQVATPSIEQYAATDYTGTTAFENVLAGANAYKDIIAKASATYNVPEKLIASVMKQESNFNASAKSPAGATGLMQLMPATAKYLGVTDATNPEQNIMAGAKYLRQMLDKFDGDTSIALAAYNAGPGNVQKYNGIPPFKETQNYVQKVMTYYNA